MSNTAPSRADPVVVFPLSRWCPPQETSQPGIPPPQPQTGKDGIIQTSLVVVIKILKDPPTWLKAATTLEKPPTPIYTHLVSYVSQELTQPRSCPMVHPYQVVP